jgi:hypothetical protein
MVKIYAKTKRDGEVFKLDVSSSTAPGLELYQIPKGPNMFAFCRNAANGDAYHPAAIQD